MKKNRVSIYTAVKVGWELTWRAWVVIFPALIAMSFVIFRFVPLDAAEASATPYYQMAKSASLFTPFVGFWLGIGLFFFIVQTVAIRLFLNKDLNRK